MKQKHVAFEPVDPVEGAMMESDAKAKRSALWGGLYQQVKDAKGNYAQRQKARKSAVERVMKLLTDKHGKFKLDAIFGARGKPLPREPHGKAATKPLKRARGRVLFRPRHGAPVPRKPCRRPEKRLVQGKWILFEPIPGSDGWRRTSAKGAWMPECYDRRRR